MGEMTDEEALKVLTQGIEGASYERVGKAICVAMNSLAGKLSAAKRGSPSLLEMEKLVKWAGEKSSIKLWDAYAFNAHPAFVLGRAADVLRFLREALVPSLRCAVDDYVASAVRTNPVLWAKSMLDGIEGK